MIAPRTIAGIAPAANCGIGGPDDIGGEHHGGVELRDDERRPDRANGEAKYQECFVGGGKGDPDDGGRAENEERGINQTGTIAVAKRSDHHTRDNCNAHGGNIDVGDLTGREFKFAFDDGHQRRHGEPGEKADEKGQPG
jgi:hypothetical protein